MTETIGRSPTEARSMVATGLSPTRSLSTPTRATSTDADAGGSDASSTKPAAAAIADATPAPARAAPTAATQQAARAKATSAGSTMFASLCAKLDASKAADGATPPPEPTYEQKLAAYNTAHDAWQKSVDDYWSNMKSTRQAGGYVTDQPPAPYAGPAKPVDPNAPPPSTTTPAKPPSTIPT